MLYFLQNDSFEVGVSSLGAELHHFIKTDEKLELLWQGDPAFWTGQAPNLFPIVGELPDQHYTYNGKRYEMKRHGFARHREFELVEEHHDKLVFELTYDEETLQHYPFKFRLLVAYKLEGNQLSWTYLVTNTDHQIMYFSVGAHPAFNVPLYSGEQYSDYYLEFEEEETLSRFLLNSDGLLSGDTERVMDQQRMLPLRHDYFDKDALVFKRLKSDKVTLASKTNPRRIEVAFKDFPYLGVWDKPGPSPFVCIEPWCGIASREGGPVELNEKEGIHELRPGATFERTIHITVS
ncbi:aldose 1-epimerase family protein [Pontibacter chitinilyticus]|uniref:aldose 1-epimerase family protein n=1 Tax=Pontibacter chitinilyticus TaxID=2674989 RepID=UPI00321B6124